MIRVRLLASSGLKISGSRLRWDVPVSRAPKRRAARPVPIAVFRPRRATAIPRNPIVDREIVLAATRYSQPRTSIEPPIPANAPAIAMARK